MVPCKQQAHTLVHAAPFVQVVDARSCHLPKWSFACEQRCAYVLAWPSSKQATAQYQAAAWGLGTPDLKDQLFPISVFQGTLVCVLPAILVCVDSVSTFLTICATFLVIKKNKRYRK